MIAWSPDVRRPKVSEDSPRIGLTAEELDRLLTAAEARSPRPAEVVSLLVYIGPRIAEVLACDVDSFPTSAATASCGSRAWAARPRPNRSRRSCYEDYIGERTTGPIFSTPARQSVSATRRATR
jgi:hypothetical protein